MTGVPRSVAEHRLNIREGYSPVRQKKGARPRNMLNPSKRRMCVDFTDLNKAGPQDCYPLPEIDWKVESLCGYPFKCFLDAYKGYNQIQMAESDEEKMAFQTSQGPNWSEHRSVDLVIKSYTEAEMLRDIDEMFSEQAFKQLKPFGLKNAGTMYQRLVDKAFDSQVSRNLEVYIDDLVIKSHTKVEMLRDIDETFRTLRKIYMKLNPKKCTFGAVEGMFLGYMISPEGINRASTKQKLYYNSQQAFKQLKQHLSELPLLVASKPKVELIVYLSATHGAIRAVLMTERGTVQTPVYFVSRTLQGPELNYTPMEKLVLSLVFAAKRLRSVMMGEHNITYRPRTSVKGQILKDFLVEKPDESPLDTSVVETPQEPWTLFMNGSSCVDGSVAGLILTSPEGTKFTCVLRFQFTASNNEEEYEALIAGIRITAQMGVRNVHVSVDSKLVANQVLGAYVAKEENMIKYLEKVKSLVSGFANFSISQVPRKYLKEGTLPDDRLEASKLCIKAMQYELLEGILYRWSFLKLWLRCVGPLQADYVIREIHEGSCSMHAGPRSMVAKAMWLGYYWLTMHRDAREMIRTCNDCQIHHPSKKPRLEYYWPTMHRDAREMIRTCNDCQIHRHVPRNPQQLLTQITAPWPFYKLGIDMAGPFPEAPGNSLGQNRMPLWSPRINSLGQRQTIHKPELRGRNQGPPGREKQELDRRIPHVLWAHRTMINSSHGDTPFSLTYGTEAVIPAEIGMPTYCTAAVDVVHNDEELRLNLDLLEE
ncbi:reverse transcriptase domain-containing protein [Tanacetum coccineum]